MKSKRLVGLLLTVCLLVSVAACTAPAPAAVEENGIYTPGSYTASARGFGGNVEVTVTVDANAITAVTVGSNSETEGVGSKAVEELPAAIVAANGTEVDSVSGATLTSTAIKDAVNMALAQARGEEPATAAGIRFDPGTYTGTGRGYNADVVLDVTFSQDSITDIAIQSEAETAHVGKPAFDILFDWVKQYTSTGVDAVSGATFTSNAVLTAVNDAAKQAGCDVAALQKGGVPFKLVPGAKIQETYDVVVVGAGGAGMAAAAAAAQNGATVLVMEKEAEMGGNTIVAGGALQIVQPALVWDPEKPDAVTGIYEPTEEEVEKIHSDAGRLSVLEMILNWSEKPFDGTVTDPSSIKSVDDYDLPDRGVHAEFLPTLLKLKDQIRAYKQYADKLMRKGATEKDLVNFDSVEMHIFQSYYGGMRLNNAKTEWIYSNYALISQMCSQAYDLKPWYIEMGATFNNTTLSTLIGCMWQRINAVTGGVVDGVTYKSEAFGDSSNKWGGYFKVPESVVLSANPKNKIMTRTKATGLIQDQSGRVTGVKGAMYDGTEVEITATKGVILATGGYGANIPMVLATNQYWDADDLTADIATTNRSLAQGEGIVMAQAAGADVVGMGWTQLMPIGWADNGDLAGGNGEDVIFISPSGTGNAGKRYVNESAERDVLAQAAFDFGGEKGLFIQITNANSKGSSSGNTVEGREYICTLSEAAALLKIDEAVLKQTITEYDAYLIGASDTPSYPAKTAYRNLLGECDQDENGKYLPETYRIGSLSVRFLAPSTHHTMGGLKVDTDRRVLKADGTPIPGLYAAGEVTGGFFAGNRLGGNATTEILTAGRIAGASAATEK